MPSVLIREEVQLCKDCLSIALIRVYREYKVHVFGPEFRGGDCTVVNEYGDFETIKQCSCSTKEVHHVTN